MVMYRVFFKRFVDLIFAITAFICLLPIFSIVVIILIFTNKGSVFFFQKRTGFKERIFTIFKFKTMNDDKDSEGKLLPEKLRLTKTGIFLRKTSLDEIPQLLNIIKGDMSLIGPRPLLVKYLEFYNDEEKRRMNVRPGITGLSQINGRNHILWEDRVKFDILYVDELSFLLDMKIFLKTLLKVLRKENVTVDEGVKGRVGFEVRRDPKNAGLYDNNGFPIKNNE